MNSKVWISTSRPIPLHWRNTLLRDIPKEEWREVVGPITVYLHHRGARRPIGKVGGRMLMVQADIQGLQQLIRDMTLKGYSPSLIAYKARSRFFDDFLKFGGWSGPMRTKLHRSLELALSVEREIRSDKYWDAQENAEAAE